MPRLHQQPTTDKRRREPRDLHASFAFDDDYCADVARVMRRVQSVTAYCDTIELYVPGMRPTDAQWHALDLKIKAIQSERKIRNKAYRTPWFEPVIWKDITIGWRYAINRPYAETLRLLDQMVGGWSVYLHRADIAYDFKTATARQARAIQQHMVRHLILRWCRSPYMPDIEGETVCWAKYKNVPKRKRPLRNLVGYSDRPLKLDGGHGFHLELRAISALAVKRMCRVEDRDMVPSDILKLDPAEYFARNCQLVGDFGIEQLRKSIPRLRHPTQDFRAQMLHRYSQIKLDKMDISSLGMPTQLTF